MSILKWLRTRYFGKPIEMEESENDTLLRQNDPSLMLPKDDVNQYFVQHMITFNERLKPGQKIDLVWAYKPGKISHDMIEVVEGNCQCTAKIEWGKAGVRAIFTHEEKDVPAGGRAYTKHVTVRLRDGIAKVSNGRGGLMWPPEKGTIQLYFTGILMP